MRAFPETHPRSGIIQTSSSDYSSFDSVRHPLCAFSSVRTISHTTQTQPTRLCRQYARLSTSAPTSSPYSPTQNSTPTSCLRSIASYHRSCHQSRYTPMQQFELAHKHYPRSADVASFCPPKSQDRWRPKKSHGHETADPRHEGAK